MRTINKAAAPSKSPPEGETLRYFFKALPTGEGWEGLL
nr:hypothetical protein [Mucilaginibacter sp. FT3.2]